MYNGRLKLKKIHPHKYIYMHVLYIFDWLQLCIQYLVIQHPFIIHPCELFSVNSNILFWTMTCSTTHIKAEQITTLGGV